MVDTLSTKKVLELPSWFPHYGCACAFGALSESTSFVFFSFSSSHLENNTHKTRYPRTRKTLQGDSKELEQEESLLSFSPLLYYLKC